MAPHPDLTSLARDALATGRALALPDDGRNPAVLPLPHADGGTPLEPMLGVICGRSVVAVAYPAEIVFQHGDEVRDLTVGVGVCRLGRTTIIDPTPAARPECWQPLDHLHPGGCVTFDLGLRALALPTPPATETVGELMDRVWLDRILDLVLAADLGEPPRWATISGCHPWADGRTAEPAALRRARSAPPPGWERLRQAVARSNLANQIMSAPLARWFDAGSFARRLLASFPEPDAVLADLDELLRPADTDRVRSVLAPGRRHA